VQGHELTVVGARAPAGLGSAIPAAEAPEGRDHRDKPGDDMGVGRDSRPRRGRAFLRRLPGL